MSIAADFERCISQLLMPADAASCALQCSKFIRNSPPKPDATNEEKLQM